MFITKQDSMLLENSIILFVKYYDPFQKDVKICLNGKLRYKEHVVNGIENSLKVKILVKLLILEKLYLELSCFMNHFLN